MTAIVLDASAVLALVQGEPGSERVSAALASSIMSAVNFAEVAGKLAERGLAEDAIGVLLDDYPVRIVPFNKQQAILAGVLRPATRRMGLSLGDRACLALALAEQADVLTADRAWLQAGVLAGLRIVCIR